VKVPTKSEILAQTIQNSHAVIVEIPLGFGFDFAEKQLELPLQSEVIRLLPTIHEGRKTEQITVADIEELQSKMIVRGGREQFVIFQRILLALIISFFIDIKTSLKIMKSNVVAILTKSIC
jgi:hypothetical protein